MKAISSLNKLQSFSFQSKVGTDVFEALFTLGKNIDLAKQILFSIKKIILQKLPNIANIIICTNIKFIFHY